MRWNPRLQCKPEPSTGSHKTCCAMHMHPGFPRPSHWCLTSNVHFIKSCVFLGVGIYGIPPMDTLLKWHIWNFTNGSAYTDTLYGLNTNGSAYSKLPGIRNLALLGNSNLCFLHNPCDSVEARFNFFEPTHQPTKDGVLSKSCTHTHTHVNCSRMRCYPCICKCNI